MIVKLRNLKLKDVDGMLEWMHDPNSNLCFRRNMQGMTKEDAVTFIQDNGCITQESENRHYAVVDETDTYLGTISLKKINFIHKDAEYAVSLRSSARGTGIASEATTLILQVAFGELGLEKVYLNVLSTNIRAIRFYEKIGFVENEIFRKHALEEEKQEGLKWYGITKEDFEA